MNMRTAMGMMLTLALCGQQMTIAVDTGAALERQESWQEQCKEFLKRECKEILKRNWKKIVVAVAVCGGVCVLCLLNRENRGPSVCLSSTGVSFELDESRAANLKMFVDPDRAYMDDLDRLDADVEYVPAYRCDNASRMRPNGCRLTITIREPLVGPACKQWGDLRMKCGVGGSEEIFERMIAEQLRLYKIPSTWLSRRCYDYRAHSIRIVAFMGDQEYLDATQHNS